MSKHNLQPIGRSQKFIVSFDGIHDKWCMSKLAEEDSCTFFRFSADAVIFLTFFDTIQCFKTSCNEKFGWSLDLQNSEWDIKRAMQETDLKWGITLTWYSCIIVFRFHQHNADTRTDIYCNIWIRITKIKRLFNYWSIFARMFEGKTFRMTIDVTVSINKINT